MSVGEARIPSGSIKYFPSGNAVGRVAKAKTDASSLGAARMLAARPSTAGINAKVPGAALKPMDEIQSRGCGCRSIHLESLSAVTGVIGMAARRSVVRNGSIERDSLMGFSNCAERKMETDFLRNRALPDPGGARDILQGVDMLARRHQRCDGPPVEDQCRLV